MVPRLFDESEFRREGHGRVEASAGQTGAASGPAEKGHGTKCSCRRRLAR